MKTVIFCIIFFRVNFCCFAQITENLLWSEVDLSDFGVDSSYNEQLKQKNQQGNLSDCEFGKKIANEEFNNKSYIYFSRELVGYCVYCHILQHDYGVRCRFLSDLFSDEYYRCYNEEMSQLLIGKYGFDIFKQSSDKANSLLNSKPASVYDNSKICIPDLIQEKKKIFIKDSYIEDTLKIRFKVEVIFENPLIDTVQPMIVKSINLIDLDVRAVNPPQVIAFLSKLTPIESPLQQYIWDLCSAKISYWYKHQPYEKLPQGERTRYGDRLYMTAICYLVPLDRRSEDVKSSGVDRNGNIVQSNHYYPFGLTLAISTDQGVQPYKYTGKELDMQHGLMQYDYEARQYDPAIGRFTTMDPLAEKYYPVSPYAYCLNNPVKYVDPDGMSTHTDSLGHVVAVYNNDDMGVYKHNISADAYDGSELTADGGIRMGETEYWDEFSPIYSDGGKSFNIQFGKSFDPIIAQMHEKAGGMNLVEIAQASKGGGLFDIKKNYSNVGALLNGKYATSRSAGNFLAGYNAESGTYKGIGISFETFQKLAGALHIEESHGKTLSKTQMANIVFAGTYIGGSDIMTFIKPPTHGELPYQYRMSKMGWNYGKKK